MREIEDLLSKVLPHAPNCPEPMAVEHLREAAISLCKATRCWREVDSFTTTGDEIEVVCVPPYASLFQMEWARFNDRLLEAVSAGPDILTHEGGTPWGYTQRSPNSLIIEPAAAGILTVSMFLMPAPEATDLPEFMFDQFARALGDGALSTLLLLPNQPYTNPQLAVHFEQKFQTVLDRNFAFNMKGQQRARKRTKPNFQ